MSTRYDVIAPRTYKDRDGNERTSFLKVGVAFAMREKDGFTITLEAIPAPDREGGFRLMMVPPREPTENAGRSPERRAPASAPQMDDDIPFAPEVR